ncbi:MAG TPA: cytochrome c [Gemmatimonadaceae bacterium]
MRPVFVVAIAICATLGCRRAQDVRETRDFERMRVQQRYDAYGKSAFFANGAVLQPPPAHTIARPPAYATITPRPPEFFSGRARDGTYLTSIPMTIDDRSRELAAKQFAISCAPCHGTNGFGGGTIAPNLASKRPPSLRSAAIDTLPHGKIFSFITNGIVRMPAYGWQMPPETRWALVAYVKSLASQPPTATSQTDSVRAASLRQIDSLHASGASLRQILKQTSVP